MEDSQQPPRKRRIRPEDEPVEIIYERAPMSTGLMIGLVVASIALVVMVVLLVLRLSNPAGLDQASLQGSQQSLQDTVEQGGAMNSGGSAAEEAARQAAAPVVPEGVYYVGQKVCEKCHKDEAAKMSKVRMSSAIDRLINSVDVPDAMSRPGCLGCHTTGFQLPRAPGAADSVYFNIQCEACHGPGSEYVKHMKRKGFKASDPEKVAAAAKVGLVSRPDKDNTCLRCHHTEPGGPEWDYASHREFIRHWAGP